MEKLKNNAKLWIIIAAVVIVAVVGIVWAISSRDGNDNNGSNNTDSSGQVDSSSQTGQQKTLDYLAQTLEAKFDLGERGVPMFQIIGATNGVIWQKNGKVAIYEYTTEMALEQAFENFPMMSEQGWVTNGRFVLETGENDVRDFFATIE